jgi:hypothetical protein
MRAFTYIPDGRPQLGCRQLRTDFTHPGWIGLQNRFLGGETTALLDNTTLRQALILMRDGLDNDDSNYAALLPDLTTLFFAYAYFDRIAVLDQGLLKEERDLVSHIFPEIDVVCWSDIAGVKNAAGDTLAAEYHLQLTTIQSEFLNRTRLHKSWAEGWSVIYGTAVHPVSFREHNIDALLNSPIEMAEAWTQDVAPPTLAVLGAREYGSPAWAQSLSSDETWSALASFHTYRSIFYYGLSEEFGWNYVPCGVRGVATNTIPLDALRKENHALNPDFKYLTLQLARQIPTGADDIEKLRIQAPLLQVSPTLAILLKWLLRYVPARRHGFDHDMWPSLAREWRAGSTDTRTQLQEWVQTLEQNPFERRAFEELLSRTFKQSDASDETGSSVVSLVIGGIGLSAALMNPANHLFAVQGFVKGLSTLLQQAPHFWDLVSLAGPRRNLKFLLRSRELASNALFLEPLCREVWGRSFSKRERAYLRGLQDADPTYGI